MESSDIFVRSAKGDQEIATQANKLPIKHRSVLIMIDGKSSEQNLQGKLSGMFDGKAILNDLESHGFIERKAAPKPTIPDPALSRAASSKQGSMLANIVDRVKEMTEEYEKK
jgi:hypothetical protein